MFPMHCMWLFLITKLQFAAGRSQNTTPDLISLTLHQTSINNNKSFFKFHEWNEQLHETMKIHCHQRMDTCHTPPLPHLDQHGSKASRTWRPACKQWQKTNKRQTHSPDTELRIYEKHTMTNNYDYEKPQLQPSRIQSCMTSEPEDRTGQHRRKPWPGRWTRNLQQTTAKYSRQ